MQEDQIIDDLIFEGSDHPFDTKDMIFEWFHKQLSNYTSPQQLASMDRAEVCDAEVLVAMVYRLTSIYGNSVTSASDVIKWRKDLLKFFDEETLEAGDADAVTEWRSNIVANFARLEDLLDAQ